MPVFDSPCGMSVLEDVVNAKEKEFLIAIW